MERASELIRIPDAVLVAGGESGLGRRASGVELRATDGCLSVTVPDAVVEAEPIVIAAGYGRVEVSVGKGAAVSLCFATEEGETHRTFAVGEHGSLRVAEVVTGRSVRADHETRLAAGARAELVTVELSDGEASLAYDTLLEGRGAEAVQAAIFMAGDGERKADFCERTCKAFAGVIDEALAKGVERLAIVAHGGTQMASLERFGRPARGYYDWCAGNGGGFVLDASRWKTDRVLDLVGTVDYGNPPAKEAQ